MFKKISVLLMLVLTMTMTFGGCGSSSEATSSNKDVASDVTSDDEADVTSDDSEDAENEADGELLTGTHHIEIDIKDYGKISAELYADKAPETVTNFVNLAKEGFYDGLTFHRIISGFMIQGGDPEGNGTGGSGENIKGEFEENGFENDIEHVRGVLSMARAQDYDSASSQFFIMHADASYLDGQYAAFGMVTEGIEVVDKICETVAVEDGNGTVLPENQPVITSIKVID
ncbi:MAG: peptidylprolyl isomerase [Lachnospiraceae bacterium]|nr:peptidylprolyl isomerase [Lachnospiraceae bacterium]MBQ2320813.1 peptidylprolyl isomerase [Lachnospiraceae bacterium]